MRNKISRIEAIKDSTLNFISGGNCSCLVKGTQQPVYEAAVPPTCEEICCYAYKASHWSFDKDRNIPCPDYRLLSTIINTMANILCKTE